MSCRTSVPEPYLSPTFSKLIKVASLAEEVEEMLAWALRPETTDSQDPAASRCSYPFFGKFTIVPACAAGSVAAGLIAFPLRDNAPFSAVMETDCPS